MVHSHRSAVRLLLTAFTVSASLMLAACGGKQAPVPATPGPPTPQSFPGQSTPNRPPDPPAPVPEPPPIILEAPVVASDPLAGLDTDEINRQSPLAPVFFGLDSDTVDADGQRVLAANAAVLKQYPSWAVTIEGHSDERGTAEYNLALGERRALAVKSYLLSLGIAADRIRTVSYGKEFPFDPGHDEAAWAKNRRGHFVVTGK
ncbi:MAG: peptidoglycan-associated lipoprotein Pal [Acidimicrobiia bacterium]|nr:peptidoglycan-associated lipoprotein Pal [Acidimicrobiia bacterium]